MTTGETYSYPEGRNRRPEDAPDYGAFPPHLADKRENPLSALVRSKPATPAQPAPSLRAVPEVETSPAAEQPSPASSTSAPVQPPNKRDAHRGSTAMLPASLVAAVDKRRSETKLSAGSIVVDAIDEHLNDLPELLRERPTTNTAGFRTREKLRDPNKENTTLFAYRLSGADFATLDHLVESLGARDRTHLMCTALTAYFKDEP